MKNVITSIASRLVALKNCEKTGNAEWLARHDEALDKLEEFLPSGSGFDSGTTLDREASTSSKLVFDTSFHHMDEYGGYIGWTEHTVTVEADFVLGFGIDITGEDPDGSFHDFVAEAFTHYLEADALESEQPDGEKRRLRALGFEVPRCASATG